MEYLQTKIRDVVILKPKVFGDERGFFMETFRLDEMVAVGINEPFVQDNHSGSRQGVLRGIHYQVRRPQGKLVRVISGEIFDVAVDLRKDSPTYGHWVGVNISVENRFQLWIPPGFGHGFYVLSCWAEVIYKATDYYAPEFERTVSWDDPNLHIEWPIIPGIPLSVSGKDQKGIPLRNAEPVILE